MELDLQEKQSKHVEELGELCKLLGTGVCILDDLQPQLYAYIYDFHQGRIPLPRDIRSKKHLMKAVVFLEQARDVYGDLYVRDRYSMYHLYDAAMHNLWWQYLKVDRTTLPQDEEGARKQRHESFAKFLTPRKKRSLKSTEN